MAHTGKQTPEQVRKAQETHENLVARIKAERGQEGITKLRMRTTDALHARMKAELEANRR